MRIQNIKPMIFSPIKSLRSYKLLNILSVILSSIFILCGSSILTFAGSSYILSDAEKKYDYSRIVDLAKIYENGAELKKDEEKAFEYYYIAAMLSPSYESEALEYLIKKAEEGNTYAEYALAMFYDNNSKVSFDYKIIFNLYMKAAKKNYPPALFKAGYMYIYGRGVKEDVSKGGKLIKEAAKLGFIDAQIFTAQSYTENNDKRIFPVDYTEAFKWIDILAKRGSLIGKYNLGVCYFRGLGVAEDKAKAIEIWEPLLKDLNDASFSLKLGLVLSICRCYYHGYGVEKNIEKSKDICLYLKSPYGTEDEYIYFYKENVERGKDIIPEFEFN